jgi:hypothetical protein
LARASGSFSFIDAHINVAAATPTSMAAPISRLP